MLGDAIKHYRNFNNLTQHELAKLVSCSVDSVRRWETNLREPRASELKSLCKTFKCSETELLNWPSSSSIRVTLSYDWDKYEKGEINMSGNDFEVFLGKNGEISLKGAAKFISRETVEDFLAQVRLQVETAFDAQVKRGVIQPA